MQLRILYSAEKALEEAYHFYEKQFNCCSPFSTP